MREGRPRILLVKPILPYPPDQGTRVVSFEIIQALAGFCDITVLARTLRPDEEIHARALEKHCARVVTVMAPNRRSWVARIAYKVAYGLRSVFTRRTLKSLYDCPGAFVDAARRLAAEPFDLVVAEYWQLYPLFHVFPRERLVLLTHDIDLQVNRQLALLERTLPRKVLLVRRWLRERREEVRAYNSVDRVLALTERDADEVRRLTGGRASVDVLPFGVDVPADETPEGERRRDEILFMGALGAGFNRDALVYFVERIVPHLDDVDADITVVGGKLPQEIAEFGRRPRVRVVGRVPDVRRHLARATCLVIPLRFGGGLRIRTLEAMAAGLPVVCTSVAMAGMAFEPEEHYLLADDPVDFARQVRRLIDDPVLAAAIARRARSRITSAYGRPGQRERLRALFQRLAGQ
jgi:glycosyltransferase involved in cell wall biosynthesis